MSEETQHELRQKIDNLNAQFGELGGQIATQKGFFKTISDEYNLFLGLVERQHASLNELDTRRQSWMQSQTKLQELESSKLRLNSELNDAQYQLATLAITTSDDIDALKSKIVDIDEKLANTEARRSIEIRAPEAGMVTAIGPSRGRQCAVAEDRAAARHDAGRAARPEQCYWVHSQGKRVLLRYSAFPYQKFGEYRGTVLSVSHAALSSDEVKGLLAGAQPSNQTGPYYRVIVEPDSQSVSIFGEPRTLPASMQVQAYALHDRRPLYQRILDPLTTSAALRIASRRDPS
jgi:membrane fusion protein